jgi:hypothetical protein
MYKVLNSCLCGVAAYSLAWKCIFVWLSKDSPMCHRNADSGFTSPKVAAAEIVTEVDVEPEVRTKR